jgi:hypothetical protein
MFGFFVFVLIMSSVGFWFSYLLICFIILLFVALIISIGSKECWAFRLFSQTVMEEVYNVHSLVRLVKKDRNFIGQLFTSLYLIWSFVG